MSADAPLEAARALVERTYALLLDARRTREQLEAMAPSNPADQAERDHYLAMALAFEAGLQRTMEEAVAMRKQVKGSVGEEWLKGQVEGLGE